MWRGGVKVSFPDRHTYRKQMEVSAVENRIIALVAESPCTRQEIAYSLDLTYSNVSARVRLLVRDEVLCENEFGQLAIAPLEVD